MKKFLSLLACGAMLGGFAVTSHAQWGIDKIVMGNAGGNPLTLLTSGLAAPHTITIPDPGGNVNMILSGVLGGSQTINGNLILTGTLTLPTGPGSVLQADNIIAGSAAPSAGTIEIYDGVSGHKISITDGNLGAGDVSALIPAINTGSPFIMGSPTAAQTINNGLTVNGGTTVNNGLTITSGLLIGSGAISSSAALTMAPVSTVNVGFGLTLDAGTSTLTDGGVLNLSGGPATGGAGNGGALFVTGGPSASGTGGAVSIDGGTGGLGGGILNLGTNSGTVNIGKAGTGTTTFPGIVHFNNAPSIPLAANDIFVGSNPGGVATAVAMSQDASIVASGAVTVSQASGTFNSIGNFSVNTNKFNVTASSGNTTVAGTLSAGASTLGATTATTMNSPAIGRIAPGTGVFTSAAATPAVTISNTHNAGGDVALSVSTTKPGGAGGGIGLQITQGNLSVQSGNVGIAAGTFGVGGHTIVDASGDLTNIGFAQIATGAGLTNLFGTGTGAANTFGNGTGTNQINGSTTFGSALNMGSHQINSVTGPTVATDAATKGYVDGQVAATTAAGTANHLAIYTGTNAIGSDANLSDAAGTLTYSGAGGFAGVGTSLTGTAAGLTAGNVTTDANLSGPVTSTGNATAIAANALSESMVNNLTTDLGNKAAKGANSDITSLTGLTTPLAISEGGTGSATVASANQFFANAGAGTAPAFRSIATTDLPSGGQIIINAGSGIAVSGSPVAPGGTVTITNNGVSSIAGTANQITPSASSGSVTLSLPAAVIAPGTFEATTSVKDDGLVTAGIVTNAAGGLMGTTATVPIANGGTGAATVAGVNQFFANTTSGTAPGFRSITAADVPGVVVTAPAAAQSIQATADNIVPLTIKQHSGTQAVDLQDWTDPTGATKLTTIDALGDISTFGGFLTVDVTTNNPGISITNSGGNFDILGNSSHWSVDNNGNITTDHTISTTSTGTITSAGLLTGSNGLTVTGAGTSISGGTINLNNDATANGTNINTGTNTGSVAIGNTATTGITMNSAGAIKEATGAHVFGYADDAGTAGVYTTPNNASVVQVDAASGTTDVAGPAVVTNGQILYIHNGTASAFLGTGIGAIAAIPSTQTWGFVYAGGAWRHIQ